MNTEKIRNGTASPTLSEQLDKPSKEAVATGRREPYYLTYMKNRGGNPKHKAALKAPINDVVAERCRQNAKEVHMNQRELDVLNVLHATEDPMTATDIVDSMKGLTQSTVIAVLRKLLKEGLVEVAGVTHSGKVLSRTYKPTSAVKDALLEHFAQQYTSFSNVVSLEELMAFLKQRDKKEGAR